MEGLDEVALGLEMGLVGTAVADKSSESGVCTCGIKLQTGTRLVYLLLLFADVVTDSVEAGVVSYSQLHQGSDLIDRLLYTWITLVVCSWLLFFWDFSINIRFFKVCKGEKETNMIYVSRILITHDFFVMLIEDILTTSVYMALVYEDAISLNDLTTLTNQISAVTTLAACCFQTILYCRRAAKVVFLSVKPYKIIFKDYRPIWLHVLLTFIAATTVAVASFKLVIVLEVGIAFIGILYVMALWLSLWICILPCSRWCFDFWRPTCRRYCECCNNKVVPLRPNRND